MNIKTVTVIGAGVMGAQIAALLSEAGVKVFLLDIPYKKDDNSNGSSDKSLLAKNAIKKLAKLKPAVWMSSNAHSRLIPGNLEDDLSVIAESDWIIEAVIEKLDIKKSVHQKIATYLKQGSIVTTNTSGILLEHLKKELSDDYARSFFGTHFFNPPRYMDLVEIITHDKTNQELVTKLSQWIEKKLGKKLVHCSDTINFIANRIGVFSLISTAHQAQKLAINPETTDLLTGKMLARPSSATYRTMDVVGIDTSLFVAQNVYDNVLDDPYRSMFLPPELLDHLFKLGYLGQKTNFQGVYKKTKNKGNTQILSYNLQKSCYEPTKVEQISWLKEAYKIKDYYEKLKFIINQDDKYAQLVWHSLASVFSYSALLVDQIAAGSLSKIDNAMKWGFNWENGVFKTWQGLGINFVIDKIQSDTDYKLPQWISDCKNLKDFAFYKPCPLNYQYYISTDKTEYNPITKKDQKIPQPNYSIPLPPSCVSKATANPTELDPRFITGNSSASLLDIGDDVVALNFHSKMNAVNSEILQMIVKSVEITQHNYKAMIIANDGKAFCAGADLKMMLGLIKNNQFSEVDQMIRNFQAAMQLLKFSSFPVVSAVKGLALGGGCEVVLHSTHRHLHSESYIGLVEAGVGLIPAAGGTKELAIRAYKLSTQDYSLDSFEVLKPLFMQVAMAEVSNSGFNAVEKCLIPKHNTTFSLSSAHHTYEAKQIALNAYETGFFPNTVEQNIKVLGSAGFETFKMLIYNFAQGGMISEYDSVVAQQLGYVMSGGNLDAHTTVSEKWFLDLERNAFLELCRQKPTQDRIEHMLTTGKPLRN